MSFFVAASAQTNEYLDSVNGFRQEREKTARDPVNTFFCDKSKMANFKGLRWYPVYLNYKVNAKFTVAPDREYSDALTFNRQPKMRIRKYGAVNFDLKGQNFTLNVYQIERLATTPEGKNYLYIPFRDLTNNDETYAGGRYVDFSTLNATDSKIDFNLAYSPHCAYDICNICPMPPAENTRRVRVEAGEKLYEKKDKGENEKLGGLFFENYGENHAVNLPIFCAVEVNL
ncbi:MAG TPA: DUF1684 domain-containing protein [Pyrinomonadaceae bacterium]